MGGEEEGEEARPLLAAGTSQQWGSGLAAACQAFSGLQKIYLKNNIRITAVISLNVIMPEARNYTLVSERNKFKINI